VRAFFPSISLYSVFILLFVICLYPEQGTENRHRKDKENIRKYKKIQRKDKKDKVR
jgi:hypothetical protein